MVAVAPATVRRDGRVQAQGRPCDHARLGAAEVELDAACGPGTIEQVAAGVHLSGKIQLWVMDRNFPGYPGSPG
jgi:hypothetical protein